MEEMIAYNRNTDIVQAENFNADLLYRFVSYIDASPKTVETYTKALRQFFNYLALNGIKNPSRDDIISFREELKASGYKPTTIQNYITAIRIFFRWLSDEGLYSNIADHLKGAKLDRQHKKDYLTSSQVKEVMQGIDQDKEKGLRDYAILALMITCGLRTIEVVRANVEDLRTVGDGTVLYVQGKGREEKTEFVKISAPVEKAIRAYLKFRRNPDSKSPLFTSTSNNNRGKRLTTRTVSSIAKKSMQSAGYDSERLTAHSLRHTAVTLALLADKDITEVQQFARHSNIATTLIYSHHLDKTKNSCSDAITEAIF